MNTIESLMAASYPAAVIERWTGRDGWPCFRIFVIAGPDDEPIGDDIEYQTYPQARDAAEAFAATLLPAGFHILDMTREHPYG